MKKTVTLALAFALVLGLLSGCANADKPADSREQPCRRNAIPRRIH